MLEKKGTSDGSVSAFVSALRSRLLTQAAAMRPTIRSAIAPTTRIPQVEIMPIDVCTVDWMSWLICSVSMILWAPK